MASSDNLTSLDPWVFRSAFPSVSDPWLCDPIFTPRDSDSSALITKALTQYSISPLITPPTATTSELNGGFFTSPANNSSFSNILQNGSGSATKMNYAPSESTPTATTALSAAAASQSMSVSGSGSEPETPASSERNLQTGLVVPTSSASKMKKKIVKRKSRASKKSPTTFITADVANFRQMVQEITGAKFPPFSAGGVSILRPEPQRIHHELSGGGSGDRRTGVGCLPTLDSSAFLLNHHHHRLQVESVVAVTGSMELPVRMSRVGEDGTAAEVGGDSGGFGFDGYSSCFPTLESCSSWKVK